MPAKIIKRTTARRARKNSARRSDKKRPGRARCNGPEAKAPRVIGSSLFTVKFETKPGLEVCEKLGRKVNREAWEDDDDYNAMYRDLRKTFIHAMKIFKQSDTAYDPLKAGIDIGKSIGMIVIAFENNILPKGYSLNVERDKGGYYFSLNYECDFNNFWHGFEIKPIIDALKHKRKFKLLNLFFKIMKAFWRQTEIGSYWGGACDYAEMYLTEQLDYINEEEFDSEADKEDRVTKLADCILNYESGEAKKYADRIAKEKQLPVKSLQKSLYRFHQADPVVIWLKQLLSFLEWPGSMSDFEREEDYEEGVRFDQQVTILWDWEDIFSELQGEYLESDANGCGIHQPTLRIDVKPNSKTIDFDSIKEKEQWPFLLSNLQEKQRDLIDQLKKEKPKK